MADPKKCTDCGCDLPADAPGGHCPKCLLGFAEQPDEIDLLPVSTVHVVAPQKISRSGEPGDSIGHYKLLEKIGEGGCGVVYMAEQQEPLRRRVALKVIKPGMDSKEVLGRFEAERQVLAMMDHPNIAKVFDAGTTSSGRPFFVMELVAGVKITEYCDQNNLSTKDRLEIFVQACRAIHHAHQKGIIHRDIKPSNILVTLHDGIPVPKVIDFGIAKATTGQVLTDKTFFTAFEQFIGTPAYMSPEQAEMSGLGIDPRSDIYSLGVLLYELLTGQLPFDSKELIEAGLDGMRRMIREKDPMRPSTRLSTLKAEERTTVAKRRQTEPAKLVNLLRGDLDWIVMKCLEKDRSRRYETPSSLALDIQRSLNQQPIIACPPGKLYRLQKLVRRKKSALAAGAAMAATLVFAVAISTHMQKNERPLSLSVEDRRKLDALMQIVGDAAKAATPEDRVKVLHEYLTKSAEFSVAHPTQTNLWVTRAAVAVELNDADAGLEAGRKLRELGLTNSDNARVREILVDLERNGWMASKNPNRNASSLLVNSLAGTTKDTANSPVEPDDQSVAAAFHDDLAPYGKWMNLGGPSYWQPNAVTLGGDWRPYSDNGRWVYTDDGWTLDSDYEWGWAAFHYGRWVNDTVLGWIWQPGSVWAPAWVAWRGDEAYCGWAPLPPGALYRPGIGFLFHGASVGMDFDFGLEANDYCFIHIADIWNPNYAASLVPSARVMAVYQQTTIIKNAYLQNDQRIINAGMALDRVKQATHRDLRPMKVTAVTSSRDDALRASRNSGDTFIIYRPNMNLAGHSQQLAAKPVGRETDILDDLINSKNEARTSRPEPPVRAADVINDLLADGHPSAQRPAQDSYDGLIGKLLTHDPETPVRKVTSTASTFQGGSSERTPGQPAHPAVVRPDSHPGLRAIQPTAEPPPTHPEVRPNVGGGYSSQPTEPEKQQAAREMSLRLKADEQERQIAARQELGRLRQVQQARMRAVPDHLQKFDEQSNRELQNPRPYNPP